MTDEIKFQYSLSDERAHNGKFAHCGVIDKHFPCIGKCCCESRTIMGVTYEKSCDNCNIWASPPNGGSLSITYLFNCSLYNYDKRIKE
jgi:hypothetical protein